MVELYQSSFSTLMQQSWGPQLVFLPLGLLFTVCFGYVDIKYAKYNFFHALYFVLIAYAVIWTPLAMVGIVNALDQTNLYRAFTPQAFSILSAVASWVCISVAVLSPVAGLFIAYVAVRRTFKCTPQQAYQFMYRWSIANLVLGVLLAISMPNYVKV